MKEYLLGYCKGNRWGQITFLAKAVCSLSVGIILLLMAEFFQLLGLSRASDQFLDWYFMACDLDLMGDL